MARRHRDPDFQHVIDKQVVPLGGNVGLPILELVDADGRR
jgi:hypothetical protein